MNIITATRVSDNEQIIKRIPSDDLAKSHFAAFQASPKYTNVQLNAAAPAAPVAAPAPAKEQTGRVGKGVHVHRLVLGSSVCGASFRRGLGAQRPTYVTGETVTCGNCKAAR